MRKVFVIEYDDELGPMWMNKDNLKTCLDTDAYCGRGLITHVDDITEQYNQLNEIILKALDRIRRK